MAENFQNKFASYEMVEPPKIDKSFFNQPEEDFSFIDVPFKEEQRVEAVPVLETPSKIKVRKTRAKKIVSKMKPELPKTKVFSDKNDFVQTMTKVYKKVLSDKGLSTSYAKKLVAQDGLESGWGKSQSGKNNFGGIKGKGTVALTSEEIGGVRKKVKQEFRDFSSLEEYANYKVDLLNNKRYHAFDGGDFFANIVRGGYATSSTYLDGLIKTYNSIA